MVEVLNITDNPHLLNQIVLKYIGTIDEIYDILDEAKIDVGSDLIELRNMSYEEERNHQRGGRQPMLDASGEPMFP